MSKLKIKDKVKFDFAGSSETGVIISFYKNGDVLVFDGKYKYPVKKEILTKIKQMSITKIPKKNNKFYVTDLTTTFPVEKSDLLLYFLEDGIVGKTWRLGLTTTFTYESFTLTKENYKEVSKLVKNSKYYSDNCYILNKDLIELNKNK